MPPGDLPEFLVRELDCSRTLFRNPARRHHRRRYYRIARSSKVEESLFGPSHREVHPDNKDCFPQHQKEADEWKKQRQKEWDKTQEKTQRHVTKDLIRYTKHPECRFAEDQSVILGPTDYNRILGESHVITPQMRQEATERALKETAEKLKEVADRKQAVKIMDLQRRKNEKLNDLEEEEKVKAEVLLKKANEMRLEQEDEIKYLNELIMNAKCQVIRDHQLKEKSDMKKDLKDEDVRLDLEMERDRINGIRIQEEIERKRREERLIGAMKIMEQIKENEQERLLDLERKDQENQMMLRYLDKLCEEEAEMRERQRQDKIRLREELNQCNEDLLKRKELDSEQDKMIDENVLQFQKEKAEREAAFEREQERIRREKEAETARLRALQERAIDEQAIRDALRAKRASEQAERNWRKKEAMDAVLKAETEQMLKKSRLKQIEEKQHYAGIQAQREKADFQRVLRAQQELIEKEKRDLDVFKKKQKAFREGITAQIREKEQVKIGERIAFFEEGVRLQREARLRRQKLEVVKEKKLKQLRYLGLPEKYVARVEHKSQQSLKPRLGIVL